jgi:hypothetical protein
MNQIEIQDSMKDLLGRANVSLEVIGDVVIAALRAALDVAADQVGDRAPDKLWWEQYYRLTGDHMHLTEDGWIPAAMNTLACTGCEPAEVLKEVNKPDVDAEQLAEALRYANVRDIGEDERRYRIQAAIKLLPTV